MKVTLKRKNIDHGKNNDNNNNDNNNNNNNNDNDKKKKKQKTCEMNMNILQSVASHKQNLVGLQILFKQCHKY